jgi:hypothetical protein
VGAGSSADFADSVTGGTATVAGGMLEFDGGMSATLKFDNGSGAPTYGEAIFTDPTDLDVTVNGFAGTMPNLMDSDGIELTGDWTIKSEKTLDGNTTLVLKNGGETATFVFDDFSGTLNIKQVNGNADTLITDPVSASSSSTPAVSVGGAGNDTFFFHPGEGAETITNFNPQADTIELDRFASVQNTQALAAAITTDAHGDALIELGHNDSVTIPGVSGTYLQQHLTSLVHLH